MVLTIRCKCTEVLPKTQWGPLNYEQWCKKEVERINGVEHFEVAAVNYAIGKDGQDDLCWIERSLE